MAPENLLLMAHAHGVYQAACARALSWQNLAQAHPMAFGHYLQHVLHLRFHRQKALMKNLHSIFPIVTARLDTLTGKLSVEIEKTGTLKIGWL